MAPVISQIEEQFSDKSEGNIESESSQKDPNAHKKFVFWYTWRFLRMIYGYIEA